MVKRILPCVFKTALNKKPLFFINSRCKCWCEGRWRRSTWAESETRNNCHRYIWYIDQLYPDARFFFFFSVLSWGTVKRATKNVQLVLWLFCKTSWLAMLPVLPTTKNKPCNLICCKTGLNVSGKTRNVAFQLVLLQCRKTNCVFFVARLQ